MSNLNYYEARALRGDFNRRGSGAAAAAPSSEAATGLELPRPQTVTMAEATNTLE